MLDPLLVASPSALPISGFTVVESVFDVYVYKT